MNCPCSPVILDHFHEIIQIVATQAHAIKCVETFVAIRKQKLLLKITEFNVTADRTTRLSIGRKCHSLLRVNSQVHEIAIK